MIKAYLIGKNVTYSYSKIIHEMIDNNISYDLLSLDEEKLITFINNKEYDFLNITNPYKNIVIKYLDILDITVKETNVCNLIINKNNKLYGYNTDIYGFFQSLKYQQENQNVLILGTGSTSKSITNVLNKKHHHIYYSTRQITNINNNIYNYQDLNKIQDKINIIINTTPNGTNSFNDDKLIDLSSFNNLKYVYDVVYNPYRTNLLLEASKLNIPYQNGLDMLINQAWCVYQNNYLDLNFNSNIDLNNIKFQLLNITLIGMPSSGKSTIGKFLSEKYHKRLFDTDIEIENKYNIKIKHYLNNNTVSDFRQKEEDLILNTSFNNMIISTGGGMIMNDVIMNYLKKHSLIVYLDIDLDTYLNNYIIDDNHPLIKNKEDLINLYKQRINKYKQYADIIITNKDITNTINLIGELIYEKENINH